MGVRGLRTSGRGLIGNLAIFPFDSFRYPSHPLDSDSAKYPLKPNETNENLEDCKHSISATISGSVFRSGTGTCEWAPSGVHCACEWTRRWGWVCSLLRWYCGG